MNERLDLILTATQKTIHSVSNLITRSAVKDTDVNRLHVCPEIQQQSTSTIEHSSTFDRNIEQFIQSVEVTRNSIDRLVMNGSRNLTTKCELFTDEGVFLCLNEVMEEINTICHSLLDKIQSALVKFKQLICSESMELL